MNRNDICRCSQCGWNWTLRKACAPKKCPKCQTVYWNTAKPETAAIRQPGQVGALPKYPDVAELAVGTEILLPWPEDVKAKSYMSGTIGRYGKRHGKIFFFRGHPRGLFVFRKS